MKIPKYNQEPPLYSLAPIRTQRIWLFLVPSRSVKKTNYQNLSMSGVNDKIPLMMKIPKHNQESLMFFKFLIKTLEDKDQYYVP